MLGWLLSERHLIWRKVEAAYGFDVIANNATFDDLVAEKREDPVIDENRTGIAVPVQARYPTVIVVDRRGRCVERSLGGERQGVIRDEQNPSRPLARVAGFSTGHSHDRDTEHTGVWTVLAIEEPAEEARFCCYLIDRFRNEVARTSRRWKFIRESECLRGLSTSPRPLDG